MIKSQITVMTVKIRWTAFKTNPEPQITVQSPTLSEKAQQALHDEQDAALTHIHDISLRLQEVNDKFDNWAKYYNNQYRDYCKWIAEGQVGGSKSEFDIILLREQQEVTRAIIQGETDLEKAVSYARNLGVIFNEVDQESSFPDRSDDGYRESMEATWIAHVDREWIHNWMNQFEKAPEQMIECDDWPSRSVEIPDSVSVINEVKKERERIDRWRSTCELLEMERTKDGEM